MKINNKNFEKEKKLKCFFIDNYVKIKGKNKKRIP